MVVFNLVLASAFFVPQVIVSPYYGMMSDRVGRKPVLLFGLVGAALCMLLFGVSHNLAWAVSSRALCGLFNGLSR